MTDRTTFRDIERALGIADELQEPRESLEIWYESVRDRPIADFDVEDLCKACRQKLYPEHVVPIAIQHLHDDPLAGEKYDGELLVALGRIPSEYWTSNPAPAGALRDILEGLEGIDPDLAEDVTQLRARIQ